MKREANRFIPSRKLQILSQFRGKNRAPPEVPLLFKKVSLPGESCRVCLVPMRRIHAETLGESPFPVEVDIRDYGSHQYRESPAANARNPAKELTLFILDSIRRIGIPTVVTFH
jgi:hypothetical protein